MSVEITVEGIDKKTFDKLKEQYPKEAHASMVKAINRTLVHARKEISAAVTKDYQIASTPVKKVMVLKKPKISSNGIDGELTATGYRLRMGLFRPTASKVTKKGVVKPPQVTIKRGSRKQLPNNYFTFNSKVTGKREVFKRENMGKYKYGYGFSLSIPQMISDMKGTSGAYPKEREEIEEFMRRQFEHDMNYRISKLNNQQ